MPMLDIILTLILVLFFANGYRKGLIGGILQLAGILLTFLLLGRSAPLVKIGLMDKLGLGPVLATIFSYLLVLILISVIVQLVRIAMEQLLKLMHLNFINRILGAVFGLLAGLFFFAILLILIDLMPVRQKFHQATEKSYIVKIVRVMKGEMLGVMHQPKPQEIE
jgi:membrane protein required for colicin V production